MNKNNKTKDLIYNTAVKLLRENGSLILKDISEAANVNIAAINYYFGDKDTLIKSIIKSQLHDLKTTLLEYLSQVQTTHKTQKESLIVILTYLYDFAYLNLGILRYIFGTNNSKIAEEAIYIYIHEIALDSKFMDTIISQANNVWDLKSVRQFKIKYTQLISTFCFPLVLELNMLKINFDYFTSLKDKTFREKYIDQLCDTFFQSVPD